MNRDTEQELAFHPALVEDRASVANWSAYIDWLLERDDPHNSQALA